MLKVRLPNRDLEALQRLFRKHFVNGDRLWLFGSRTDLAKRGGDIDLYVETHAKTMDDAIQMRSDFLGDLEQEIGEQKIDIVLNMLNFPYALPVHEVARKEGIRIV
jgi:predicted nucleotidyltransferase